nr:reverse transcriptase domain-containing protein [Tanacetum cinerariifolium]
MKLWDLKVKGTNLASYTQRYQELDLMCERMFSKESDKIEKYIGGLLDMIHGSVVASKPNTMQEAIEIATELMDKKFVLSLNVKQRAKGSLRIPQETLRTNNNNQTRGRTPAEFTPQHLVKRSNMGDLNPYALNAIITTTVHVLRSAATATKLAILPPNKRQNTGRAYTVRHGEKKHYSGSKPLCSKCNYHHDGPCAPKCHQYNRLGHLARD